MLSVWRKAALFDPTASGAATWIFTIARNLRIDAIRRERRGGGIRVDEVEAEYEADDAPLADARIVVRAVGRSRSQGARDAAGRAIDGDPDVVLRGTSAFRDRESAADPAGDRQVARSAGDEAAARIVGNGAMTIEHHPEEATLAAYAAGVLDLGQRVALATHLRSCPRCRDWVRAMEQLGGALRRGFARRPK